MTAVPIDITQAEMTAVLALGTHLLACRAGCTLAGRRCSEGLRLRVLALAVWDARDRIQGAMS